MTLMKFWRQLPESDQNPHRCKIAKCSSGVADTKGHPWRQSSARECPTRPRETKPSQEIVTPECADAMRVSEHYASTPCTRTQRLLVNSMMSKCRTRQPESCDTPSAFLHDWLSSECAWTEPPTDLRLNDGRCWLLVKALPAL